MKELLVLLVVAFVAYIIGIVRGKAEIVREFEAAGILPQVDELVARSKSKRDVATQALLPLR